jgi:hypothetical protein
LPDRIVAKKTVGWKDFYLVHWLGFTAAERTWEPAAFFDAYCTKQTHGYQQARRPLRIVAQKVRPPRYRPKPKHSRATSAGGSEETFFYEVLWQGQSETTMEAEETMRHEYPDLVKTWDHSRQQQQQEERKTVGKPQRLTKASTAGMPAKARATGGEPLAKSRRLSEGGAGAAAGAAAVDVSVAVSVIDGPAAGATADGAPSHV